MNASVHLPFGKPAGGIDNFVNLRVMQHMSDTA
jgi:hypothetical protein